eukprot:TRINITY_DN22867_c0_g1_i1.p1 TRINITY_DN22867_c0_g1~~TRINITY_DN22867_c0_g1_i1.p1  ORF type:complete len:398 (-),score=54.66 TRINITY_DN22867_c0_g1_i1:70-1263(-)
MSLAFVSPGAPGTATWQNRAGVATDVTGGAMAQPVPDHLVSSSAACITMAAAVAVAARFSSKRRQAVRARSMLQQARRSPAARAVPSQRGSRAVAFALSDLRGLFQRTSAAAKGEMNSAILRKTAASDVGNGADADGGFNAYAVKMVKIFLIVTVIPFLFCLKNFFTNPALSDFSLEYGPHLADPLLRATSSFQAVMVALALFWREKNRDAPMDRLFAWLFVPEAIFHVLLHFLSHHNWIGNFAFGYAFSAGIALPGFLSLMAYCPNEKKLPWMYIILYIATQIPICCGLTDMVGPAKMRLNFANLNTATITGPFFYGIMKRWKDVPKLPVFLACGVITYQVTMGIVGPINAATVLKLYDPSVVFQHAVVDVGFAFAYAASIYYGLFLPGKPQPKFS